MIDYDKICELGIKLENNSKKDLNEFQKMMNGYRKDTKNKYLLYPMEFTMKLQQDMISIINKNNPEILMCLNKDETAFTSPKNPYYSYFNKLNFYNSIKLTNSKNTILILGFSIVNNCGNDKYTEFFCNNSYYNLDRMFITIIGPDIDKYTKYDLELLWIKFKLKYNYNPIELINWLKNGYDIPILEKYYSKEYIDKVFKGVKIIEEISKASNDNEYEFL